MHLVVHTDKLLQNELFSNGTDPELKVSMVNRVGDFHNYHDADGFIDLMFDFSRETIDVLKSLPAKPTIVNSVSLTLQQMQLPVVRINAWPGFLQRQIIEASCQNANIKPQFSKIFTAFNKRVEWLDDTPGFVTPRVVAMMINEAWFALEQGVSTKEEIDIAMKLGTNHPFGPFEWGAKIGLVNIYNLLYELNKSNPRYQPSELLKKEALQWQ